MHVFVSAKMTVMCARSDETRRNQNQKLHRQRDRYECTTTALLVYDLTYWHLHLSIPLFREKKMSNDYCWFSIHKWAVKCEVKIRIARAVHVSFVFSRGEKCATILLGKVQFRVLSPPRTHFSFAKKKKGDGDTFETEKEIDRERKRERESEKSERGSERLGNIEAGNIV